MHYLHSCNEISIEYRWICEKCGKVGTDSYIGFTPQELPNPNFPSGWSMVGQSPRYFKFYCPDCWSGDPGV